jgi:CMP/dCMP kinase
MKKLTIAIDGYSSCGKSTLAKALAKLLDYTFIDSGAMYRGITLYALENGFISASQVNAEALIASLHTIDLSFQHVAATDKKHLYLNGKDVEHKIREMEVANNVSQIASIKEVREKLVDAQRKMGEDGGVIMDGRDIGSVVFPNAELKLFVTASPEIRAQRRFLELKNQGKTVTLEEVAKNLQERDHQDSTRKESPLIQVEDAILLDNSHLSQEEQLEFAHSLVLQKIEELG